LRRFLRNNPNLFLIGLSLFLILAIVVAIFWVLTSPQFVKP